MQFSSSDHKNNNLRKSVFTKMSKTEDLLVSQLSSWFHRRVICILQLTKCNKTRLIFADVGSSSVILVQFNFSSSLTKSHFSVKEKKNPQHFLNKNEQSVLFIYSKCPNPYFLNEEEGIGRQGLHWCIWPEMSAGGSKLFYSPSIAGNDVPENRAGFKWAVPTLVATDAQPGACEKRKSYQRLWASGWKNHVYDSASRIRVLKSEFKLECHN